jgi:hypothetical protein
MLKCPRREFIQVKYLKKKLSIVIYDNLQVAEETIRYIDDGITPLKCYSIDTVKRKVIEITCSGKFNPSLTPNLGYSYEAIQYHALSSFSYNTIHTIVLSQWEVYSQIRC